ncbi:MAG: fibronectin type III domain-containing protein [Anaerolineales bacterium]|nr:fibronectin type III domain-containing protein [Anaerolineales bacterium]MCX7608571.1 fibronectin type III domain-containing protein [Anaerolineales bacterium]
MDYKVYITLGFHINFYHSWRGDTPDEAGFGTDMRVIRGILDILDRANAAGKQARGYWDTEVYWTFQEILPKHCPDILERIQRRVAAGLDEIVLGPFNNGANHAATADEFRAAIEWAIENPWGSGLRQLFGKVAPFYRPQECMFTTGQEQILKACGVEGLLLYYALTPFNTLAAFTPALPLERRFNPLWFRSHEDQPPLILFPCLSITDLFEYVSLENLMLDLHERQQRGEIRSDVLIHLNADADLEAWLPMHLPPFLAWAPNTGGLEEFITAVNKYPWAAFTVPSEYLAAHPPTGEILVRQDLADGAFDGNYSWAEKYPSLLAWTLLERSRLASLRAETLASRLGLDLRAALWDGMDSSFFQRLIGLSTTHFGMSTPVINEERQARAFAILSRAAERAEAAEREAIRAWKTVAPPPADNLLYEFEIVAAPSARDLPVPAGRVAIRLPLILPPKVEAVRLEDIHGNPIPVSLTEVACLSGGLRRAEACFVTSVGPNAVTRFRLYPAPFSTSHPVQSSPIRLSNPWLEVLFSEQCGIQSFRHLGVEVGGPDFLRPFVSYRTGRKPAMYSAGRYAFVPLESETWNGLQRVRLQTSIPMQTPHGEYDSELTFTFTLFDDLPYLYVDVEAAYAYTPTTDLIHNMLQKLRRLMDLRWVEVAPFQLTPRLLPPVGQPLRVWKRNYLGITSYYDLNYGEMNPRNREPDALNHQVTAGWVAVSDRTRGLLLGENAEKLASMAFCPMRLRERDGRQVVSLNPFGSYHGRMFDYSHLGGNGVGAALQRALGGQFNPNGPSYNGKTVRFALLLAPYAGDEPPADLQAEALLHFYPPEIVFYATPAGVQAETAEDVRRLVEAKEKQAQQAVQVRLDPPTAFLVNPISGGAVLVWDAPRGQVVTGYEAAWRLAQGGEWQMIASGDSTRLQIDGLEEGKEYLFRVRSVCAHPEGKEPLRSAWTQERACTPGAVTAAPIGAMLSRLPVKAMLKLVFLSVKATLRAKRR